MCLLSCRRTFWGFVFRGYDAGLLLWMMLDLCLLLSYLGIVKCGFRSRAGV